ncbi:MAG: hypothetical protein ACFFDT_20145, partial [Candidatus Hodarchaeota archaeon]
DGDGLLDGDEVQVYITNPLNSDSDNDGLTDGEEILIFITDPLDSDSDVDGLTDQEEVQVYLTNPLDPDSDGDGLSDGEEVQKHNTDPLDRDSDDDFFPDRWDYGWMGNPHNNWDNPLTRSMLLILMISIVSLGLWMSFIVYHLPKLRRDLNLLHKHFQQYVQQFQENLSVMKTHESLEELEIAAEHMDITFQSYEEFFIFVQHLVKHKWLPSFLRPDLRTWNPDLVTLKLAYDDFQQTRLKRLDAKY